MWSVPSLADEDTLAGAISVSKGYLKESECTSLDRSR